MEQLVSVMYDVVGDLGVGLNVLPAARHRPIVVTQCTMVITF